MVVRIRVRGAGRRGFKRSWLAIPAVFLAGTVIAACGTPALEWQDEDGYRWAELRPSGRDTPGFEQLAGSETGITFTNVVTEEQYTANSHYVNGSGVALGDVDGDGLVDVYFASMDGPNVLYRNLGDWRFEEIAAQAGVAAAGRFSTGATFADVDGDDDLDLLLTALGGPNGLFLNDGTGSFTDATEAAGLASTLGSMSMALADVDGDGDLDLYVTNNKVATVQDLYPPEALQPSKIYRRVGDSFEILPEFREHYVLGELEGNFVPRLELAEPDRFYLNDGSGRFTRVPFSGGAFLDEDGEPLEEEPREWALSVRFQDMDGDGDPDIYVCNDFHSPDHIWINDGSGRFRALSSGALRNTSFASMGIDFSDVDRDGNMDFFLVEMLSRDHRRRKTQLGGGMPDLPFPGQFDSRPQKPRNTLFLNRGDGTWAEAAQYAGVEASEWSWGSLFLDVDLDGYEDLLIGNGHFYDAMDKDAARQTGSVDWRRRITVFPRLDLRNIAFRNRGDMTFEEVGAEWGFAGEEDISHGMAAADLDDDGDLDIVINRLGSPAAVLRNQTTAARVAVRLEGQAPNTRAIGARIRLSGGSLPIQTKEVIAGGSYLSGSDPLASFAAAGDAMTLEITWRNGAVTRIEGVAANRIYEISETGGAAAGSEGDAAPPPAAGSEGDPATQPARARDHPEPLFEDVSDRIAHTHVEGPYDDFSRQPLIPVRLSQGGPGVTWFDADGDGDEDLFITSGVGGRLAQYRNDGRGGFTPVRDPALGGTVDRDQTTVLGLWDEAGAPLLAVGSSTYEAGNLELPSASLYALSGGRARATQTLPPDISSVGAMASADFDGDGDLDLFVGGRVIPGKYPARASSRLFLSDGGRFVLDEANSGRLADIGLVSGAVFGDFDGDGDPDLILAVEWGPVRLFVNRDGRFQDMTFDVGLGEYTGWWRGVTTGDLDEDGQLDIIATNRGLNTEFRATREHPALLYHGDLDNNGTWDVLEARFDEGMQAVVPVRGLLTVGGALPMLRSRIQGFAHYGSLSLAEIIGPPLEGADVLEATTLAHTVFFGRDGQFEAVPLPATAQLAPGFAVAVADMDGDGHEDVFLSQNLFALRSQVDRADSGLGLLLRGDGTGALEAVAPAASGIRVLGEQRGAALADFDADGRVDLAVSQNGAATRLYHNLGAKPGLRVRLRGHTANPQAIGAAIRLRYEDGWGPLREIHGGSGYWSQDAAVQVLGKRSEPTAVWVRWPGGAETETPVPAGALEVTIGEDGRRIGGAP